MKEIRLNQNKTALVDDEDFELIKTYRWYCFKSRYTFYAISQWYENGERKHVLMHRLILNVPDGFILDHKNKNGLDNQKENLRLCTHNQNKQNSKMRRHNKSGFRGVHYSKRDKLFYSRIGIDGKRLWIGCFKTAKAAALAYDKYAIKHHGEFAQLNFLERRD